MAGFRVFFVSVKFRVFEIAREEVFLLRPFLSLRSSDSTLPPRNIKNNFFVFCLSGETFLKREEEAHNDEGKGDEEGTKNAHQRFALVCLSRGVVVAARSSLFLPLSPIIFSLLKNATCLRGRRDQSNPKRG